jgi:hypothetical protein
MSDTREFPKRCMRDGKNFSLHHAADATMQASRIQRISTVSYQRLDVGGHERPLRKEHGLD